MNYLTVDLYHKFNCIADSCPNTCCRGWNIDIEEEIYQKMQDNEDKLGISAEDWICPRKDAYAVKLNSDGRCPMLNENNLCKVVLSLGPSYLSKVCNTYPRMIRQYGDVIEGFVTLSCFHVVDELMSMEKVYFNFTEDGSPISPYSYTKLYLYESSIRTNVIDLLYFFHDISLSTRLFTSFNIINEAISNYVGDNSDFTVVQKFIDSCYENNVMTSLDSQLQSMISESTRYQFLPQLLSVLPNAVRSDFLPDHVALITQALEYFGKTDSEKFRKDMALFKEAMKPYEKFHTNYWVYCIFSDLLSLPDPSKIKENFLFIAIQFCLMQLLSLAAFSQNHTLSKDEYIYIISTVNRLHHSIQKKFIDKLQENNLDNNLGILLLIV